MHVFCLTVGVFTLFAALSSSAAACGQVALYGMVAAATDRDSVASSVAVAEGSTNARQPTPQAPQGRAEPPASTPQIVFSVSNNEALNYPPSIHYLPDEHTTVLPATGPVFRDRIPGQPGPHYFFVAMSNLLRNNMYDGTFVLKSSDFRHFTFAPGFGNAGHGQAVFWAPHPGSGNCGYSTVTHFDEQYVGAGSVFQDPTLPTGNLIMIYEAEVHCPRAPNGMGAGWASIGVARSSDGGKNWPTPTIQPGFKSDWLEYGSGRYAGITLPGTPPRTVYNQFYGDALPSAFIDDMDPSGDYYLYVPYQFTGRPKTPADAKIHIARAKLGDRLGHHEAGRLHFYKWHHGGWTQEGLGGLEDGVTPPCGASYGEGGAQIEYNDALQRYVMTFVCTTYTCQPSGKCKPTRLSLYYTTATRLAVQDWTPPQPIENSTYPDVVEPNGGEVVDGGYPSFVSPGCEPGHIGTSGTVFLLKGNVLGERHFVARSFTIKPASAVAYRPPALANGCRPHPSPAPAPARVPGH